VGITDDRISYFKKMKSVFEKIKDDADQLVVFSDNADFFIDECELPERISFDPEVVSVIELTDDEFTALNNPEQDIRYGSMYFSASGIKFDGYGKHTGEEFWAELQYKDIF
jgi:hypothetical protein